MSEEEKRVNTNYDENGEHQYGRWDSVTKEEDARRFGLHEKKVRHGRRMNLAFELCVVLVFVVLMATPAVAVVNYSFNVYPREGLPLDNASNYLDTAAANVPENYPAAALNIQLAHSDVNTSDNATGAGTGSNCYLWVQQTSTYGYVDGLMDKAYAMTVWAESHHPLLSNTTVANTTGIGNLIALAAQDINEGSQNLLLCVQVGNFQWFEDAAAYAGTVGALVVAALVVRKLK